MWTCRGVGVLKGGCIEVLVFGSVDVLGSRDRFSDLSLEAGSCGLSSVAVWLANAGVRQGRCFSRHFEVGIGYPHHGQMCSVFQSLMGIEPECVFWIVVLKQKRNARFCPAHFVFQAIDPLIFVIYQYQR